MPLFALSPRWFAALPAPVSAAVSGWRRSVRLGVAGVVLVGSAGCTTTSIVLSVAGVATDTSVSWEIAKHLHAKITEGDPIPCMSLNSVQRALSGRCGEFVAGSLRADDITRHGLQQCPLTVATRDPALWPVLPELLNKGAQPEACEQSPLAALAAVHPCPDFSAASPAARQSLAWLAQADARAVRHDVVRLLTCPSARGAGLDQVVAGWVDGGVFHRDVGFGLLGALHPDMLSQPIARTIEGQGHTAQASLGPSAGRLMSGFEEALRTGNVAALDWWLDRAPQLANRAPPARGGSTDWSPLGRVLSPKFLADPSRQQELVEFLMARGADPWKPLPGTPHTSVVSYARFLQSPMLGVLDPPWMSDSPKPERLMAQAGP